MQTPASTDTSFIEFTQEDLEKSIVDRFEQQVDNYSDRLAIKTKSAELNYTELNRMANRIARAVCANAQKSTQAIALLFEPGISLIAAILGVLKAGKIWVSLDPTHPIDRISYIIDDSQASLILSNQNSLYLAHKLGKKKTSVINIDDIELNFHDQNLNLTIPADAPAHIIYTSGSSGQPKGVLHNHRLVLHNIKGHTNSLRICPADRLSLFASLSHQAGIADMFRALLNGATLLPFNLKNEGFSYLASWIVQEKITIYHSVPTVFRQLIKTLDGNEEFPHLRVIHLGGETVLKHDIELYKKHFSSKCILLVILGSTEVPTYRQNFITKKTDLINGIVAVGNAVEDKEILILNNHKQIMRPNQVGEIAVRSRFLATEYWRKPNLTKMAFLPDPEGREKRIYRTGDLGKILEDGSLIYLGRKDKQVKIGGQRIEIAEIENVLLGHSQVKTCAVVMLGKIEEERYLAAYFESTDQQKPSVTELIIYLKKKLPDYMIPSKFVYLESMPLLPNGKIDRLALPEPDRLRPKLETEYVAPRSDLERQIADIWQELLRIDQIGINDDFFELGGHSLLATQLLSRINKLFKISLPLKRIFGAPTVKTIAILIDMVIGTAASQKRVIDSASEEREKIII